ncbi:unnamed protein product [Phytophthora lilii]|uniref:Unnamed protein product n=1 Tax=Phytophthora lilii TaxID=2077276 RepID=A0A9W6U691_9STRA|nr:unnamed protein product [Phytophthora lilii]
MADTSAASASAAISPDAEQLRTSQSDHRVEETKAHTADPDLALDRRSWSSQASQSSEDEDDGWTVTPAARGRARSSSEELTQQDEADVEASVRAALRLLEDSGEAAESEGEAGGYVDFVREVMEDRWTLEGDHGQWRTPDGQEGQLEDAQESEEDAREDKQEEQEQEQEQTQVDEWQEAYTAKGRVQYRSSEDQPQPAAAAMEEEPDLHHSVLRQSLGYHPSASASAVSTMERQTTLFCNFCGEEKPADELAEHFNECATAKFHKRRMSPLYSSFERALGLMSEDATLRSLHYAASFPDPTPNGRPGATSMQDSLLLLRTSRRRGITKEPSSTESTPQKQGSRRSRVFGLVDKSSQESQDGDSRQEVDKLSARRATDDTSKKKRSISKRKTSQPTNGFAPVKQQMETCRYCNRSFAEGRLAKHEAVCPRIFGNEGSWGRGTPSNQASPPNPRTHRVGTPPSSAGSTTSKLHKLKDHTLQQSYKEHQATLVLCPCCRRKFAPSGAQQHIAICKGVQNRPKNPIPLLRDYAIAG